MSAFVNHQVVGLGEPSLAELTDEFTFWSHFATEIRPTIIIIDSHYGEHDGGLAFVWLLNSTQHEVSGSAQRFPQMMICEKIR